MKKELTQLCRVMTLLVMPLASTVHAQETTAIDAPAPDVAAEAPVTAVEAGAEAIAPIDETIPVSVAESDADESDQSPRVKSRLIEEVIVTAQKREENLQDVPISINAFSAGVLDAKGIVGIDNLPTVTPGLTINNTAGFSIIYLRGVGTDAFLFADPSVAAYIDGVYSPFTQGLGQDLGVVERIEVAKGPQGTLFGRNAVAGAINVVTRDPGPDPETSITLAYSNYDTLKSKIYTNIPLSDGLSVSLAALYSDVGSYLSGSVAGKPVPDETTRGARLKVKVSLADNIDAIFAGSISELQGIGSYAAPNFSPSPVIGRALLLPAQDDYSTNISAPAYSTVDTRTYSVAIKGTFDWFDVKLLGSDQDVQSRSLYEYDGTELPIAEFEPRDFNAQFKTAELQIISNQTSWGSEWLEWIGGLYYFQGSQAFDPISLIVGGTDLRTNRLFGVTIPQSLSDLLLLNQFENDLNLPNGRVRVDGAVDTDSYSGFGQATVHFTDWVALTLGARYQRETRDLIRATAGIEQTDGGTVVNYLDAPQDSATTSSFKPKISLDFRPADGTLLYLSYQQAIKSGTYNPINVLSLPSYAGPEKLTAYEAGLKLDLLGGLVRLNTAAFRYEITDLQVQFVSLLNGGVVSVETAGGATIQGLDFDGTVEILPSVFDNLVFTTSAAYIPDAKYDSYENASGFDPQTGIYSGNNDYKGNRTVRTPKFSGNAGLIKTFEVNNGSIEVGGDIYYNSGYAYLAQGCELSYICQGSYYTVNARASYLYDPWGMRVTVFGNNLNEEKYSASRLITDFGANQLLAPPLTYGVRLNWDF